MKFVVLIFVTFLSTLAFAQDESFKAIIEYKLPNNRAIPADFFTALDVTEYAATLVDASGNVSGECHSAKTITWAHGFKDGYYTFELVMASYGPCKMTFGDQAGFIKMLQENLKAYPVTVR